MRDPMNQELDDLREDNARLRVALAAARTYVAKAADNFGSEWTSAYVLNQIDAALGRKES